MGEKMKEKNMEDMSVDELKIAIFDAENQIKVMNQGVRQAYQILSAKLQPQQKKPETIAEMDDDFCGNGATVPSLGLTKVCPCSGF